MKIGKVFELAYAHRLMNHPGKCKNLHGHNGKVEIQIESEINPETDMVIDFDEITQKVKWKVDELLDHSTLLYKGDDLVEPLYDFNPKIVLINYHPTAEILSSLVYDIVIENLDSLALFNCVVKFWETSDSYAECNKSLGEEILSMDLWEEYETIGKATVENVSR